MSSIETSGKRLRSWPRQHHAERRLSLRVTLSGVLTLMVSHLFHLRFPLWAVLTAVLLTQLNVGRSLKATTDYLAGTLGGAIFAGVVGALIPHHGPVGLTVVLALALLPVALIAAENPRLSAAPFTAVLVLLAPIITHLGPIASAFERMVEVAVGCVVGLVVSLAVLPSRAYDAALEAAGRMLELIARSLPELFRGLTQGRDEASKPSILQDIDLAYAGIHAIAVECMHERSTYLRSGPDLGPLLRTLGRLRDDLAMIERTAAPSLPETFRLRLAPALHRIDEATAEFLRTSGDALLARAKPGPCRPVEVALDDFVASMAALRQHDLQQAVPADVAERIFALAFALEQLRRNCRDLERRVAEHAESGGLWPRVARK
ncbi:FUSC family protein [Bradyrhizobium cenepequi]